MAAKELKINASPEGRQIFIAVLASLITVGLLEFARKLKGGEHVVASSR